MFDHLELGVASHQNRRMVNGTGQGTTVGKGNRVFSFELGCLIDQRIRYRQYSHTQLMDAPQDLKLFFFPKTPFCQIDNFTKIYDANQPIRILLYGFFKDPGYRFRTVFSLEKSQQCMAVE